MLDQPDQGSTPVSRADARRLAAAFGLPEAEVMADARIAATWPGPTDDFLLWLKGRHEWPTAIAASYLERLRLALGRRPEER